LALKSLWLSELNLKLLGRCERTTAKLSNHPAFKLILKTLQIGLASLIAVSNSSSIPVDTLKTPEPISGKVVAEAPAFADNNSPDSQNQTRPTNVVIEMIKETSEKYGVDDNLAVEIARCESGLRQYSADGTIVRGKVNPQDVGVFQINENYHLRQSQEQGHDIYTTRGNIEYAILLIKKSGNKPWSASKPCWGDHVAMK
jgi:hypothetical protein